MNGARLGSLIAGPLCLLVLLAWSATASAAAIHEYLPGPSENVTEGVPAGQKTAEGGEALAGLEGGQSYYNMDAAPGEVAGEDGHLWIAERGRIDEFDALTGAWEEQLEPPPRLPQGGYGFNEAYSIAIGRSTGEREVYVIGGGQVFVYGPSGRRQGEWTGSDTPQKSFRGKLHEQESWVSSVAVDSSSNSSDWARGDVFVGTGGYQGAKGGVVDVFAPSAGGGEKYIAQLQGSCSTVGSIVGGTGCEPAKVVSFGGIHGVAVDRQTGDLLVTDGLGLDFFEPVGAGEYRYAKRITGVPGHSFATEVRTVATGGGSGDGDIYLAEAENSGLEDSGIALDTVVYQFDAEGAYLGRIVGTPADNEPESELFHKVVTVAVDPAGGAGDPAEGRLFIGDGRANQAIEPGRVDAYGSDLVIPDVATGVASSVSATGAVLTGTVSLDGEGEATCRFKFGPDESLSETPAPCSEKITNNSGPRPVSSVELEHLAPDTTYFYRLEATNKNGTNPGVGFPAECEGAPAQAACFTTLGPGIEEESVANVASTSATFDVNIDPNRAATDWFVEYGPGSGYGSRTAPAAVGAGKGLVALSSHVQDLLAGVLYHYRVVAVSEVKPGEAVSYYGPDETFTTPTPGAVGLPDGRVWEMVSPAQKNGAFVEPIGQEGLIQAAASGAAFTFHTNQPTEADPAGYANQEQIFSVRGTGGWSSRDIAIAHAPATGQSEGVGEDYRFFSEDLVRGIVQPAGAFIPASSSQAIAPTEASEQAAFLREDFDAAGQACAQSCYRPLVTGMPGYANVWEPEHTHFGEEGLCPDVQVACGPLFVGASPDGRHVILSSSARLTETATAGRYELYEWSAGRLVLVSVLPGGEPASEGPGLQGSGGSARHAVSNDGGRVVWHAGVHLYMTDTASGKSVELDVVRGGSGLGLPSPRFQMAAADGSRVYFVDGQRLTANADEGSDLYECSIVEEAGVPRCELSDLTTSATAGETAGVLDAAIGASEDGSWLYFVANGVLQNGGVPVAGAVKGTCLGGFKAGAECNLYVEHGGVIGLVAVLSGEDATDWGLGGSLSTLTARVSANGEWLAFMSSRALTGYDNRDAISGIRDQEVYLYHAVGGEDGGGALVCASCDPTGGRPVGELYESDLLYAGDRVWGPSSWLAANVPGWTPYRGGIAQYQSRFLSDEGRLFFNSMGALLPRDVNGTWDVYEYEPPGVGDCTTASARFSARSGGCVGLISSGTSGKESAFLDASQSGADVFFLTLAKLSAADFDQALDVYDAHECSAASACSPEAATQPPPCSTAEACRLAPTPQPEVFGAPASATFAGPGSPVASAPTAVRLVGVKAAPTANARRLAAALKACRRNKSAHKRLACEHAARKRYGTSAVRSSEITSRKGGNR